ncbi:MAG: chemotaxis protein CheC [archaeon]
MINMAYELTKSQLDAINEMCNIGVGRAATSLSKILNRKIEVTVPSFSFLPISECLNKSGNESLCGLRLAMEGDIKGETVLLFEESAAQTLSRMVCNSAGIESAWSREEENGAFCEFANIFIGNFLNAISDMLCFRITPGLPQETATSLRLVLENLMHMESMSSVSNYLLLINSAFFVSEKNIEGEILLFFTDDSLQLLLGRLQNKII